MTIVLKMHTGQNILKLTVDSFVRNIVHVEALGAVSSTNFVAVFQLLLCSSRQSQHNQRADYTEHECRLHSISEKAKNYSD